MSHVIHSNIPSQDIFFKPYTQRFHAFYDHQDSKNKYYITSEFGKFTRIVGQNTIIEGLEVSSVSNTNTDITVNINKGRLIINDTYIEINDDDLTTFDQANMLDDEGFFVLTCSFINDESLRKVQLRYHFTYFDQNNNSFGEFNKEKDKIILGVFEFSKNSSNYINSVTHLDNLENITLDSENYIVRNNKTNQLKTVIDGGLAGIDLSALPDEQFLGGNAIDELLVTQDDFGTINVLQLS